MFFELWLRDLLCDAVSRNMAHVVARVSPAVLRSLCERGVSPTVEAVFAHYQYQSQEARKAAWGISMADKETSDVPRIRTWREIAYEMTHEPNRVRVIALSRELVETFKTQQKPGSE